MASLHCPRSGRNPQGKGIQQAPCRGTSMATRRIRAGAGDSFLPQAHGPPQRRKEWHRHAKRHTQETFCRNSHQAPIWSGKDNHHHRPGGAAPADGQITPRSRLPRLPQPVPTRPDTVQHLEPRPPTPGRRPRQHRAPRTAVETPEDRTEAARPQCFRPGTYGCYLRSPAPGTARRHEGR